MEKKIYASLNSIGAYVPNKIVTNDDLSKIVDTSDEWIQKRTGIKERRFADSTEATSDLATKAAQLAIKRAKLTPNEIDMVIVATISPDFLCMPSTACVVANNLGIINKPAFDISAACSGFIYLLYLAKSFIESRACKNILIIGAEKLSSIIDMEDRSTCVLFGDGAGAAVIGSSEDPSQAILDVRVASNGGYQEFLMTPGCGSRNPANAKMLEDRLQFIKMKGNETFKIAVKTLTNDVIEIMKNNHLTKDDIDFFIPHQANLRIISAVGESLGFPIEKVAQSVQKYGNTSAASIPMAMNDYYEAGALKKGSRLLLDAFGGGLTWGSAILSFNGE
ncbi:beta-ketoacyl-ACP synthase III [Helicobacter canadensis]|uniref:Beta-ketoacyl-[acyl-carrier-protein] synthase III n=1 Tax=Helicobacter canadensis MIT 98-5491 TaxID=537970 RepID=C5ZV20_9HELI|nr:beta-ketoacyl-ACP synthase III [Helicobacter canadensis]EES88834.1 3-oxoacyl-(acyl-carrier-protein) synthase III [Helicobacter canadensis MIT 98-5491]EFR48868.1 3-oxoacyl-(acyl carrier protein) synthase III [Helicobacter canadensis MIT 98-5491]STP00100.1 3-oxoacyl-ACP synthase [Helicobacter canadensis]